MSGTDERIDSIAQSFERNDRERLYQVQATLPRERGRHRNQVFTYFAIAGSDTEAIARVREHFRKQHPPHGVQWRAEPTLFSRAAFSKSELK